jgi:hypothetical protein
VLYANTPFTLEAVLCNEDFLSPGTYPAEARIKGRNGIVWQKQFDAVYPKESFADLPPLAATVLKETISLPEGSYTLHLRLAEGAYPYGGELHFDVVEPKQNKLPTTVLGWGLADETKRFLVAHGVTVTEDLTAAPSAIFVGNPENASDPTVWTRLLTLAEEGAKVVFLNPELWQKEEALPYLRTIAGERAICQPTIDWLYHFDAVHVRHPLFDRIHDEGMLDMECFAELFPRVIFEHTKKADLTVCASIQVSSMQHSLTIGEYALGKGRVILNDFRIEEALGKNPYADQLLLNFVSHYGR